MDAVRFITGVLVSGQPFAAGQTAVLGADIDADEALRMVALGRAEPASTPAASSPESKPRAKRKRADGHAPEDAE